jgi:hypothetical protein
MFAREQANDLQVRPNPQGAQSRFEHDVARVEPIATACCQSQLAGRKDKVRDMQARIGDEIISILGHEDGHHIADHIEKSHQQALACALVPLAIIATSQAYATQANPRHDVTYVPRLDGKTMLAGQAFAAMKAASRRPRTQGHRPGLRLKEVIDLSGIAGADQHRPRRVKHLMLM